ncbi:type II toxin-antitoxin system RelE/ParE family toxin [Candidatus Sumerlaeota bacterium]|nr:type II toxin-antitoxin system RelE/ParE family toxin [Candidatus Sumerlaeota bacterium]
MKAIFVETREFTKRIARFLTDRLYARLQNDLMRMPDMGDVIQGSGGLRKVRIADRNRGKGKRGGARVIYLYVPEARWFLLLDVYGKNEKEDLGTAEKKILSRLAAEFKRQAFLAARNG